MATANTQFYKGFVTFGGTKIPVLPGVRLSAPHNWDLPPIAGNYVQVNRGEGARTAVLTFQCAVLGNVSGSPMDTTLLYGTGSIMKSLLARTNNAAHDTTGVAVTFFDGRVLWTLADAKVERVTLSCARGQRLAMDVTVIAPSLSGDATNTATLGQTGSTGWDNSGSPGQVMTFANVNFNSPLNDSVVSFELTYQNNHTPDPSLNGNQANSISGFANAINASTATATLGLTFQSADYSGSGTEFGGLIAQGGSAAIRFDPGSTPGYTYTTGALILQNPNDRQLTMPRQFISTAYAIVGGANSVAVQWNTTYTANPLIQIAVDGS